MPWLVTVRALPDRQDVLRRTQVLGEAAEPLEVEEDRRRDPVPPAVGRGRCGEREVGLAGRRLERRQRARSASRSTRRGERRSCSARSRGVCRRSEGHPDDAPGEILAVVGVDVRDRAGAVGRVAVEDPARVDAACRRRDRPAPESRRHGSERGARRPTAREKSSRRRRGAARIPPASCPCRSAARNFGEKRMSK